MRGYMPDFRIENGRHSVSSEALGYWFLRLNGFLTIPNFVVHPDTCARTGEHTAGSFSARNAGAE